MDTESQVITVGCRVEIILRDRAGKEEHLTVTLVPSEAADFTNGYLGINTPLARALINEKAGAVIPYLKDDIYSIEVLSVTKSEASPAPDSAKKREEAMKKVMREVQDTNAIVFASSFSGKWGDYDPDSIPKDDDSEKKE